MKIDKPLSECTGEEIVASRRRTGFFAPDHKYPGINAPLERNPNVEVVFDDRPDEEVIAEELRRRGYSGFYKTVKDGVITRIVPADKLGRREDV